VTSHDPASDALLARGVPFGDLRDAVKFALVLGPAGEPQRFTADRERFLGRGGSPRAPARSRARGALDGRAGAGSIPASRAGDARARARRDARDRVRAGRGRLAARGARRRARAQRPDAVERMEAETRAFWEERVSRVRIATPLERSTRS
jgi:cellobiose phosphorylase